MLVIRMQRTGRKGHAMFRVVVQDSRRTPTSGKIVASLGSYDPHSKNVSVNKEKAQFYLDHGAQPSERVALLLKSEGVKLPKWVSVNADRSGKLRNPDKLRKNRPAEPAAEEAPAETAAEPDEPAEAPAVEEQEAAASETEATAEAVAEPAAEPEEAPAKEPEA